MPKSDNPYSSEAREQPVKVIAPKPSTTVAGALKNNQAVVDATKRR